MSGMVSRRVCGMTFTESQSCFHGQAGPDDFLGRAWHRTRRDKAPICWQSILEAHAAQSGKNPAQLKALVCP